MLYLASHEGFVMKNYLLITSTVFSALSLIYGIFNLPHLTKSAKEVGLGFKQNDKQVKTNLWI